MLFSFVIALWGGKKKNQSTIVLLWFSWPEKKKKPLCSCSPAICSIDVIFMGVLVGFLRKKEKREER